MKELINSKKKLFYITLLLTAIILTSAYALFMTFTTNTSTASIVGNLMYGISLTDENGQNINYASNEVNSASNVYITVYSLNRFTSKYALGYNSDQNVTVTLLDRNGWNSEGIIPSYSDYAYKRTFKVHIDNNSRSTSKTYFQVFGGYNYEEVDKLILDNGYTKITNTDSSISNTGELLTSIISNDTNCTSAPCLYGKDTTNNYLKLNGSSDMYRVLGNYNIDNNLTAKIAATNLLNTTSDVTSTLSTFYNSLDNEYIVETNKFNCTSSGCSESSFSGAGLLTKYEYDTIGGVNSYLNINDNYFILENNNLKELSNDGTTSTKDSSKVRPVLYLDDEVEVLGSGSIDDPFIINPKYDLTITSSGNGTVSKTSDKLVTGASTSLTITPNTGYYLSSIECTSGYSHTAQTGTSQTGVQNITITNNTTSNGTCTFNFTISSYTLTINKSGSGTLSKTSETLNYGGSTTVVVTPDRGHYLTSAECNGNYTLSGITIGSTTEQTATISNSNRTNAGTCTFTFTPQTYTVVYNCGEGSGTPPTTQTVSYGSTITTGTGGSCSKTGYTLSKWNDPTGDNRWTNWSGTWSYINGQYGITNNTLTLTAQWTVNTYTVTGYTTGNGSITSSTVTYGGTTSLTVTPNFGYHLSSFVCDNGYTWANVGGGESYTSAQYPTVTNANIDGGTTCTVLYNPNTYYIYYNANGGTGAPNTTAFLYNSGYKISTTVPTRTGYTFAYWYGSGYGDLNPGDAIPATWGSNTLVAQWTLNTYGFNINMYDPSGAERYNDCGAGRFDVSYDGGNTWSNGVCNEDRNVVSHFQQIWIRNLSPTWYYSISNVSNMIYDNGIYKLTITGAVTIDITTYNNTYYVYYNANGGTGAPDPTPFYVNQGYTISSTVPTPPSGYSFNYWDYAGNHFSPGQAIPNGWGSFTLTAQYVDNIWPTHTNWWWGSVTKDVAYLYIQANDVSGIGRVACPTSTESGGYSNWNWLTDAVWDAGANAYRCDITPASFGHYGQTYLVHLYIWDTLGNGGYYNQTTVAIPANSCTVYCDGQQCSLTRWNHGLYEGQYTCYVSTGKTGGIEACWKYNVLCDGGSEHVSPTYMCLYYGNSGLSNFDARMCNSHLSGSTYGPGLPFSGINCSCG